MACCSKRKKTTAVWQRPCEESDNVCKPFMFGLCLKMPPAIRSESVSKIKKSLHPCGENPSIFQCSAPTSTVRMSFHFQSNYGSKHKSTRHRDAALPPRWHLSGVDNRLKCFRAQKPAEMQRQARTKTDN